jgi:Skp family chaperone for outer membrane proteins
MRNKKESDSPMRFSLLPLLAVCAAGLVFSLLLPGQAPAPVAPAKVAVIEKKVADLQLKYRPRQDALQKKQQDLSDIQTMLTSNQGKLSSAGEADLQAKGERTQRQVQRLSDDLQADIDADRTEALRQGSTRMREVVQKLADAKGLDVVIDTSTAVFTKPAFDITDEAVGAYNKAYPVTGK